MSHFEVSLNQTEAGQTPKNTVSPVSGGEEPKKKRRWKKVLLVLAISLAVVFLLAAAGAFFYWQSLKSSPQYSLALLVDAARRDDQAEIDRLVDVDAVVDDFVPQITDKAVELYGRGLAPSVINKIAVAVSPYLPAVKKRARAEIPGLIREKTGRFENVPFWMIALGAERVLDIDRRGDEAFVRYDSAERPFEVKMARRGERWQIVAIKDELVARRIAEKIGQEVIAAAKSGNIEKAGKQIGIENLKDILKDTDIFR